MKYAVAEFDRLLVISLSHLEQKLIGVACRREKTCLRCLSATGVT